VGQLDGAHDVLGVVDVDVPHEGKPEQAHRLLPVDEEDDARLPPPLDPREQPLAGVLQHLLLQHRLERRQDEEQPEDLAEVDSASLRTGSVHGHPAQAPSMPTSSRWKRRGRSRCGRMKRRWSTTPATNPPTCAQKAMPDTCDDDSPATAPPRIWLRNQKSR